MSDEDDDLDITRTVGHDLDVPLLPTYYKEFADATANSDADDDDLDYIPSIHKELTTATTCTPSGTPEITETDDETGAGVQNAKPEMRTTRHPSGNGQRFVMTDASSDNEVITEWKQRRDEQRIKGGKTKEERVGRAKDLVSKRQKLVGRVKKGTQSRTRSQKWQYSDDEAIVQEGAQDERKSLPTYLQSKKEVLALAKKRLQKDKDATASAFRVPPCYDEIEFSDEERMEYLESRPKFDNPPSAPYADIHLEESLGVIPCSIAQYLRSYQVNGVRFLHRNFVLQDGCILGDDMGLGKTVQVISFLTAAFGKTGDERDAKRMRKMRQFRRRTGKDRWYPKALVVCPSSLIRNWENEFKTWGWWNVYVYHGSKEEKEIALQAAKKGSLEIMITNYETYRIRHADINMVEWDCVIADECHKIKGKSSEITKRMNEINSLCRIGLTGTAIQNNYEELWTLLNWCRPGSIGTIGEWERKIAGPLRVGQRHDATFAQIGKARRVATMLVNNLLPRLFLRRMKTLIAHQLPKKTDKIVFCPLTETQRDAYEAYLDSTVVQLIRDGNDPCDCDSGQKRHSCCYKTDAEGRKINELVFPAIIWVQKLSNHLATWVPDNTDSSHVRAQKLELLQTCLPNRWRELSTRERIYNYMDPQMCGKWIVLQRLLQFWHQNGDKVLLFSYSLNLLYILHSLFRKTEYNVCYLDGQMSLADRAKAVDDFNSDPDQFIFLISTKAGGVGLNITAANKVVIFDPNWNPSYDLQAQDRAYRIGQTRDVEVFRLISSGTIEEIVYARQIYKQQQANIGYGASEERRYFTGVMGDKENRGELFGLKNLFRFQDNTIFQGIVNKTNVAERRAGVLVADMHTENEDEDGVGEEGEEEEDGGVLYALSQLTDDLPISAKRKKKKTQAPKKSIVAAILAEAGVSYTHENSEVIGTSKVEAQISKRAMESTEDTSNGHMKAFDEGRDLVYKFRPPLDVRKRQFLTAARMLGFDNPLQFALVVEGLTQEQRRNTLERFYQMRIDGKERIDQGEDDVADGGRSETHGNADADGDVEMIDMQLSIEVGAEMEMDAELDSATWTVAVETSDDDEL